MKTFPIVLNTKHNINLAQTRVAAIPAADAETLYECVIRPFVRDHSQQQQRTFRMWLKDCSETIINEHAGNTPEYWEIFFKNEFLATIFVEDDDVGEYTVMMAHIDEIISEAPPYRKLALEKFKAKGLQTTHANVKQMSRFLECIEKWCEKAEIQLRIPEDKRWL